MPGFEVQWTSAAERDLAYFWLINEFRAEVERATRIGDQQLQRNPTGSAAIEREGLWMLDIHPLRFCYEIDESRQIVSVVGLALLQRE